MSIRELLLKKNKKTIVLKFDCHTHIIGNSLFILLNKGKFEKYQALYFYTRVADDVMESKLGVPSSIPNSVLFTSR